MNVTRHEEALIDERMAPNAGLAGIGGALPGGRPHGKAPAGDAAEPGMSRVRHRVAITLALLAGAAQAGDFSQDFAVVFADANTTARHGALPLPRTLLARALHAAADAGARGVVLKFFLDQPRTTDGDQALATAMRRLPVVLQARLAGAEAAAPPLPQRFVLDGALPPVAVGGEQGWLPLPAFADAAHAVCFVDFASSPVPLVEAYQGRPVPSLLLCAMALASGRAASLPQAGLQLGGQPLPVDGRQQVALSLADRSPLAVWSLDALAEGRVPAAALHGKVIVLGYDGPDAPLIATAAGPMGPHRLFTLLLRDAYTRMVP